MQPGSLAYKIFIDRFALKDLTRTNLKVGDMVLVHTHPGSELGKVLEILDSDQVRVQLPNKVAVYHVDHVDKPVETSYDQCCDRVASAIPTRDADKTYRDMADHKFVPAGRILAGAGSGQSVTLANCYIIKSPHDSRGGIYESLTKWSELLSRGGGVGTNFSTLRPKGALVKGVNGRSSGAVSWMEMFSQAVKTIIQGGSRMGASMIMLNDWHPDLLEFISVKKDPNKLTGANISIGLSDDFMESVQTEGNWTFRFPDTQHPQYDTEWDGDILGWESKGYPVIKYNTIESQELWRIICESAHASAEPGLFFLDRCNKLSNSHYFNKLTASNPCAEQPLPDFGLCMLGHIHLAKFARSSMMFPPQEVTKFTGSLNQWVDVEGLRDTVRNAIEFLDNSLDHSFQPLEEVIQRVKQERRIGLGTLGLGELLITLGFRYGSEASVAFCNELYEFIMHVAYHMSEELANLKGSFSAFNVDGYLASGFVKNNPLIQDIRNMRNVCLLTQAPTGSVGTMMGTSTGIEPYYSFTWERTSNLGKNIEVASVVQDYATRYKVEPIKENLPSYFVNAMDGSVSVEGHIAIQAVVQKYTCSAVSKTINVPESYTVGQVKEAYMKLYTSGCKGGTIYRDNSRNEQVLRTVEPKKEDAKPEVKPEIKKRPRVRNAKIVSVKTAMGTAHVTLTFDEVNNPLEVFVEVGKGGSDIKAFSEAFGRLISLLLRLPSSASPMDRLEEVVKQLKDIGGARPLGFGKNKSKSLPDSIAKALEELASLLQDSPEVLTQEETHVSVDTKLFNADICPACGDATLLQIEGCCSCTGCGHSEC